MNKSIATANINLLVMAEFPGNVEEFKRLNVN